MEGGGKRGGEEETVIISSSSCESRPVLRSLPGKLEMHTNCLYSEPELPDRTMIIKTQSESGFKTKTNTAEHLSYISQVLQWDLK